MTSPYEGVLAALDKFGRNTGEYWSKDNAQFEASNPHLGNRMWRGVNPMTSFGSVLGAMHDGAEAGSVPQMAIAATQAVPISGYAPLFKTLKGMHPDWGAWGATTLGDSLVSGLTDEVQAAQERKAAK